MQVDLIDAKDPATLVGLWVETFRQAYDGVHAAEDIDAYCEANFTLDAATTALADPATRCRLAMMDGKPAGLLGVRDTPCPSPLSGPSAELKQIYVLASAYGTGLGPGLFEDALSILRAWSCQWMWLCVSDWNQRAKAFYAKHDFARAGAGPVLEVGSDRLPSSILVRPVQ
ncbi:MAG: GNAT family N-acetyltransferase [Pseudomonadota bacterium]